MTTDNMSYTEVIRALGYLCANSDGSEQLFDALGIPAIAPEEHAEIFVLQLIPNASIYLSETGMLGGEQVGRIAGFWATIGYPVPKEPDHLSQLLYLYAALMDELRTSSDQYLRQSAIEKSANVLLSDYIASWLPAYLLTIKRITNSSSGVFRWAELLLETISNECKIHLTTAPDPKPIESVEPLHDAVEWLLTPRRAGIVLTKTDLVNIGSELGLGCRVGERKFVLKELLGQDSVAVAAQISRQLQAWMQTLSATSSDYELDLHQWLESANQTMTLLA